MDFQITVRSGDREVGSLMVTVTGTGAEREEQVLEVGRRLGRVLLEPALAEAVQSSRRPCCCGRAMDYRDQQTITVQTMLGPLPLVRKRFRCERCRHTIYRGDEVLCGRHRVTMPLAKRVCQLVETEHYPHVPQVLADQHGIALGHEEINELVRAVGGHADRVRRAEATAWRATPTAERCWPNPEVTPRRIYASCDGVMYCTNQTEPDPQHPDQQRLIWQQMRVGCIYWQEAQEHWRKRVLWGRETAEDFGASLFRLACRCGWREASERLFGADGGDWCWDIHARYFSEATGILDWYHASEHIWTAARLLGADSEVTAAWAEQALDHLATRGGVGLVAWLEPQRTARRGGARAALDQLLKYVRPRRELMNYPEYRAHGWQVGTGMIESTGKQLVGLRLKGPGMHWTEPGALAVAALRAIDLNGQWHRFWNNLTLTS